MLLDDIVNASLRSLALGSLLCLLLSFLLSLTCSFSICGGETRCSAWTLPLAWW
jgi:hypothetical protein